MPSDLKTIDPAADSCVEGTSQRVLAVRIVKIDEVLKLIVFPEANRLGTGLLSRLLQVRMELAGVHVSEALAALPFNSAFFLFTVSDLGLAQTAVKAELQKTGLLHLAQVAWFDGREGVYRLIHPKTGLFQRASDKELADERELQDTIVSLLERLRQAQGDHDE